MAEGASGSRRGRGGARKRDYGQLNALVQLAEGTGQAAAAPGSVHYVRADGTLASKQGKLQECGVTIAEHKDGGNSDTSFDEATLVARSTAATFTLKLPGGLQLPVTVGTVKRAESCTPVEGAGLVKSVEGDGSRVRLHLAGSISITGSRRPLKFSPPLQLMVRSGSASALPSKRPRSDSSEGESQSGGSATDGGSPGGSSSAGGGGRVETVQKKKSESITLSAGGHTTIDLSFQGADVDIKATQNRLEASGAALVSWLDAPAKLPYVLHFEALQGLQQRGGGQVTAAELERLRRQLPANGLEQGGPTAGAAGAAAAMPAPAAPQDPVARLSAQLQDLAVQQAAMQQQVATQGATLHQVCSVTQQHSSTLQQHSSTLQQHETGIVACEAGLHAQQAVNEQMGMHIEQLRGPGMGWGAWVAMPVGQQQQMNELSAVGLDGGLAAEDLQGLVSPGSPRSAQQLLQEEQEDAVPGGVPLSPQQQQPVGTDVLQDQVRQALLRHGLSRETSRTRREVAAAVRPHLPSPLHLPTVMECIKLVPRLLYELCAAGQACSRPSPAPPLDIAACFWLAPPVS